MTRVVAATEDGLPKAIVSYASESMSPEEGEKSESWKRGDLKSKMMLMRLRVKETPKQLASLDGTLSSVSLFLPERNRDYFFPQYVPVRERVSSAEFCVAWVPKAKSFRQLPDAVKADPPPLTTGLLFANSEKELTDPYQLSDRIPEVSERIWRDKA